MDKNINLQFFQALLGSNNQERKIAEEKFSLLKQVSFNESIEVFISGLDSNDLNIQNLSLLLLKKTYLDSADTYNNLLDENSKLYLKKLVFTLIQFDKNIKFLYRIADILSKIFSFENISELLGYVVKTFDSENAVARQFAIYIIESLCDLGILKDNVVEGSVENFNHIFKKGNKYTQKFIYIYRT